MNWIKQFIDRCKAQTPKVFRKVQYVAGAMSAMMIAVNSQAMEYAIELPSWWNALSPYSLLIQFHQEDLYHHDNN